MATIRLPMWQLFGVLAGVVGLTLVAYTWLAIADDEGGVGLDVPQSAYAESAGIALTIDAATFSGTATYVRISATVPDDAIREIRISGGDIAFTGSVDGSMPMSVSVVVGHPTIVRLPAVSPGEPHVLTVTGLDTVGIDGPGRTRVQGLWSLPLEDPADLNSRLRVDSPSGGSVAQKGITVAVTSVRQSATETLIGVRLEADSPVEPLGQPRLLVDGEQYYGQLLSTHEGTETLVYAFPPTPFDTALRLVFEGFVERGSMRSGTVTLNLGATIARASLHPGEERRAPISREDVLHSSDGIEATEFMFQECTNTQYPNMDCAIVFIDGAMELEPMPRVTARAIEEALPATIQATGYNRDASGAIIGDGWTALKVRYSDLADLTDGPVTLTIDGHESETTYGHWEVLIGS